MSQKFPPPKAPSIEEVTKQFEAWRKTSKVHEPIPAQLWTAAASLWATYPAYKIARKLRLNYTKLKEHLPAFKSELPIKKAGATAAFIELDLASAGKLCEYVIEMQDPSGGKMRMQLKGHQCPDLIKICKAFWGKDL
jgi:hypothetical protein